MEFNEKLQQLRTGKNLTQEQLAEQLYVSRTAISKWESGKGYPNIESLKCISKFFSVTIDELLSGEELITLAETENRSNLKKIYSFIYGILDMMAVTFILLPLYGNLVDGYIYSVNLLSFTDTTPIYLANVLYLCNIEYFGDCSLDNYYIVFKCSNEFSCYSAYYFLRHLLLASCV